MHSFFKLLNIDAQILEYRSLKRRKEEMDMKLSALTKQLLEYDAKIINLGGTSRANAEGYDDKMNSNGIKPYPRSSSQCNSTSVQQSQDEFDTGMLVKMNVDDTTKSTVKRGRGRPRKYPPKIPKSPPCPSEIDPKTGRRRRGRPRKNPIFSNNSGIKRKRGRPRKNVLNGALNKIDNKVKRKRGRPSKAEIRAREALEHTVILDKVGNDDKKNVEIGIENKTKTEHEHQSSEACEALEQTTIIEKVRIGVHENVDIGVEIETKTGH